jgi:hypothetical protein
MIAVRQQQHDHGQPCGRLQNFVPVNPFHR